MDDQSTPAYKDSMAAGLSQTPGGLGRLHLDHVEGLRALAALVVYVNHAYAQSKPMGAPDFLHGVLSPFTYSMVAGHLSVTVFIVVSGFCLTLPVVAAGD